MALELCAAQLSGESITLKADFGPKSLGIYG
jgi:hypothetical protein